MTVRPWLCLCTAIVIITIRPWLCSGTAIVMITAGMELVFDVPYIYTTPPLAIIVYSYAFFCTRFSTRAQTALTSVLTLVLGAVFSSVAIWGSYKIVNGMVSGEYRANGEHKAIHDRRVPR